MANAVSEEVTERLTCAVCMEQFKEPKVLPCLHTYCKACLEKLVKKQGSDHIITCPECRQDSKVSFKFYFTSTNIIFHSYGEITHKKCKWLVFTLFQELVVVYYNGTSPLAQETQNSGDTKFGPGKYKMPTLSLLYLLPLLKGHLYSGERDTFSESRNPGLTSIWVTP